ncbi:3544_t:CDS:2 [Ambispora leptoticha]|uniref:3544_t:CDS:1 n=1 Tax=Ambispora leptoticha TaxID=144679 RepID=A0A9N8WM83_9GLOM|nr:3544_t:CDS:2 [Ambispora leptoticha]
MDFWNSITNTINEQFRITYTGYQCKNKFQHLVRDHNLMYQYIAGSRTGKRSRTGERYFEEFRSRFWERQETAFDLMHSANTSARRRHRNRTPPPTYEVSSIPSMSRRESTTNQRHRSASPTRRVPRRDENSNRDDANNSISQPLVENNTGRDSGHNANDVGRNSGHNVDDTGGDLDGNLDDTTYDFSSDLTNITSALNISASQNDSDISMPDMGGGSQPLESINEEGRNANWKNNWHFGTVQKGSSQPTKCNSPGNPAYQINIPISDVFYDPPIPAIGYIPLVSYPHPAILDGNFIIDLYEI